jgi:hypothetical protein
MHQPKVNTEAFFRLWCLLFTTKPELIQNGAIYTQGITGSSHTLKKINQRYTDETNYYFRNVCHAYMVGELYTQGFTTNEE